MENLIDLSPEEKMQKYDELNTQTSGYVDYIPTGSPAAQPLDIPKINFNSLMPTYKPMIFSQPKVPKDLSEAKQEVVQQQPVLPKENVYAPALPITTTHMAPNTAARKAFAYYTTVHKLPKHIAAGIVGNLYQESGLDPTKKQNGGGPGRGIAQWTETERWKGLQSWAKKKGRNPLDLNSQLDFILEEPGQENAIRRTLAAKDVDEATMLFGRLFEAPRESAANWAGRKGVANHLLTLGI